MTDANVQDPLHLPIDDEETFRQFGYRGLAVGPHSTRKVIIRCVVCQTPVPRQRRQVRPDAKCRHHTSTDPAHLQVVQDSIHQRFGESGLRGLRRKAERVDPNRQVEAVCAECGKSFLRHHKAAKKPGWRCASCAGRAAIQGRNYPWDGLPIDAEETLRQFGYRPEYLKPSSTRRVVIRCTVCGKLEPRGRAFVTPDVKCLHHRFSDPVMVEKKRATLVLHLGEDAQRIITGRRRATIRTRYSGTPFTWTRRAESGAERKIKELIEGALGPDSVTKHILSCGLHIDLYVAAKRVGIEYHGLYYHHELSPAPRGPEYHARKLQEARKEGIRLLQVFEDEWNTRRSAVEEVLFSSLGRYGRRIGARKCAVREIPLAEARNFMARYHLQGASRRAIVACGLFYGEDLVGAATLARHHRHVPGTLVFDRLCFGRGVQVVGGASRLFAFLERAARERGAERIVTWSDNRWSEGNVYRQLGFVREADLPPDYQYVVVKNPKERLSKQSQKKSAVRCPAGKTEHEWALERGLARIWDCGKVRWSKHLEDR